MGGHTAVDTLILMPYLREKQHRAGGKGQGCTLVGKEGQEMVRNPRSTHPGLLPSFPQPVILCFQPSSQAAHCLSPFPSSQAFWATHILYPVDLKRGLVRDDTGQSHFPTRSDYSTFWLNQQLNPLWRHGLWAGISTSSIRKPESRPMALGLTPASHTARLGPAHP